VLSLRIHPRAKHSQIVGVKDGALVVRTTAPPADGQANKAVLKLLAEHLNIAPSRLVLLRGHTHRNKQFLLRGPF
jgi:uncharacterized protein (TIGR00251 family)